MSMAAAEAKVGELAANGAGAAAPLETQGSASSLKGQLSAGSDPAGADTPSKKKGKKGRKSLDKTADDVPAAGGGASALESAASADRGAPAEADAASDGGAKSHTGAKGGGGADAAEEQQQKQQQGAAAAGSRSATDMANPLGASKGSLLAATAQVNPDAELVRASDPLDEVRAAPVRVTDLSKQLKEQFASASTGGSGEGARDGTAGGAPRRDSSGNMASLTQHDLVNTANVALVLQAGEFKMKPGVDFVSYEQLQELRLEDGLDVSRKEEYLADAEFETVFGMDKAEFRAMPAWKRINAKKSKGLF